MYIFGGKQSIFENSNKLYRFNFDEPLWEQLEYDEKDGYAPSCVDSHNAILFHTPEGDEIIIFGGFMGGKIGNLSMDISSKATNGR